MRSEILILLSFFFSAVSQNMGFASTPQFHKVMLKTKDNVQIEVNHYKQGRSKVIVVAHGFFANKDLPVFRTIAESFLEEYDVLSLDFRGHGCSDGKFCLTAKENEDLKQVLNYAHQQYSKVGVIGFSLGAAISIVVSDETGLIDSLIVVSAPTAFEKIDFQFWRKEAIENLFYNLSSKGKGKSVKLGNPFLKKPRPRDHMNNSIPVFFIHGSNDWLIRPHHSEELYAIAKEPKKLEVIKGGLHAERIFEANPNACKQMTQDWFQSTL